MKKFIIYIISTVFAYLILLEVTTRVFDLSGHTEPEINLNNNRLLKPNSEGIWVNGGKGEIVGHYKINEQGFNSLKDYSTLDKDKLSIAIIGDSYIEGFHVDVENSIGRLLEAETQHAVEVHEYAKSGGNIVDFSLMFKQWIKNKYDYTFILVTSDDLSAKHAAFMGKGNSIPQQSVGREIYNKLSFMRYLNINHELNYKLRKVFSFSFSSPFSTVHQQKSVSSKFINASAIKEFDANCVILYEKGRLDTTLLSDYELPCVAIVPKYKRIDFGFDSHWNINGRKNCALTIKNYIESH